ncbi:TPA: NTPase, partial [Streptococcus suis]
QVDFDILNVGEFIKIYNEKNSLNIVSSDFIYDAIHSACMLIQEGVNLKFSHRSFQEYFAALGINQLDDSRQEKVLISWVESDTNNLIAHRTFIETLFSIQRERTYHNLCIPVIIKIDKLFEEWNDNEKILQALFKSFRYDAFGSEGSQISFTLSKDLGYYFR